MTGSLAGASGSCSRAKIATRPIREYDDMADENGSQARPTMTKRRKRGVPGGLWQRCPGCQATIFRKEAEKRLGVCPECDYHWYVSAQDRIRQVLDEGTFEEWDAELRPSDPLGFADKKPYPERVVAEQARTGLKE